MEDNRKIPKNITLRPDQVARIELVWKRYKLDSFSDALRHLIDKQVTEAEVCEDESDNQDKEK